MAFEFLQPISENIVTYVERLSNQSLGKKVVMHTSTDFPNLDICSLALICVNENRGAALTNDEFNFDAFRKQLYSLYPGNWQKGIADLGDVVAGESLSDTYFVVKSICEALIKKKIIPIVIGGSQDLTFAMYRAYDHLEQMVNLVAIDNQFDFAKENGKESNGYLSKIIVEEPTNLFNYSNIGYQTYYNSQEEIDLAEKLYFDAFRLGEIIKNPAVVEPVFRDADLISLDLQAVKSADSGNTVSFLPNGFDGREICLLARYAGISDKVSAFGIFNHWFSTHEFDLIAQIIWYFIEGHHYRSLEYPFEDKSNYLKYTVLVEEEELVFYKSNRSERWWIEISVKNKYNKTTNHSLLPCTHEDYLAACQDEIPERWWKAHRKSYL